MKNTHNIPEFAPDRNGPVPTPITDDDVELTPKEEAAVANPTPPDEQLAKIEKKLERDATAANQLPDQEQLKNFETKLEHDDGGNQPS